MHDERATNALFFDLDGTLLDTAPDLAAAVNYTRQSLLSLPPLPLEKLRPAVTKGTVALTEIGSGCQQHTAKFVEFRETMLAYYLDHVADLSKPFVGIDELLDHLDGMPFVWGIVTNKPTSFALPLLEASNLLSRAHCVICGDTTTRAKPHPDHLLLAAEQVGVPPARCAYVGDAATDMQASRSADMYAVAASWGYIESDDNIATWPSDIVLDNPTELLEWIKRF